jgi:membrane-bound lytic murein transglycosylase A
MQAPHPIDRIPQCSTFKFHLSSSIKISDAPVHRFKTILCLIFTVLVLGSCTPKPVTVEPLKTHPLNRLAPTDYPLFADDLNFEQLSDGIDMSLAYLRKLPVERQVAFGPDAYSVAHLIRSLEVFASIVKEKPSPELLRLKLAEKFWVYQAAGNDAGNVLFTGYYEPLLEGREKPSAAFPVPVHSRPADLVEIDLTAFAPDLKGRRITGRYLKRTVVPYPDREQIRRQSDFDTIAPPIAWLRDEIDLFNLMVQGSGKVALENGVKLQIGFDTSNGHPYRSIGRLLIDQGKISADRMSMQAIRDYLVQHPDEALQIMNHNPRYIFFRKLPSGPLGALGVPLTPRRSLAVDRGLFPSAAPAFISVPLPQVDDRGVIRQWTPFSGFVLAQDAGSAITGPGRADLFWGNGLQAEVAAGHLKHPGRLYFLILDPEAR